MLAERPCSSAVTVKWARENEALPINMLLILQMIERIAIWSKVIGEQESWWLSCPDFSALLLVLIALGPVCGRYVDRDHDASYSRLSMAVLSDIRVLSIQWGLSATNFGLTMELLFSVAMKMDHPTSRTRYSLLVIFYWRRTRLCCSSCSTVGRKVVLSKCQISKSVS